MEGSSSKNIQNIAVHLNLAERKRINNIKSDSKHKIEIKFTPSSKIKHQRNLSPWNRKKDQLRGRAVSINDELNLQVVTFIQKQIDTNNKNQTSNLTKQKMSDFLQKIHFTNKKLNSFEEQTSSYQPNKFQQNKLLSKKGSQKYPSQHNLIDLTQEEIKKIIIYPKDSQKKNFNGNKKSNSKNKYKQNSDKKMASIQNFYDPYQNQTKMSRKMIKYRLKLNDQLSQQPNTTRINDSTFSYQEFQITWRKNSIPQKVHKRNLSMPQNGVYQSKKLKDQNQKQMRKTLFFKTRTKNLSINFKTQPTQRDVQIKEDPEKYNKQLSSQKQSSFEPTYATPSGQAIKRIKHQYKKSRRIKTTQNNYRTEHSKSDIQTSTKQKNFYLYQTFLNYKSKKDSSGMNITKTLGFNFHNQQTFKSNIQKVWLKSKN